MYEREGDVMAKVITYECKECGCEIIVSGSHETHLRPIYCCGVEVKKKSSSAKAAMTKKTKEKKAPKTTKKAMKKTAAGKRTSGR